MTNPSPYNFRYPRRYELNMNTNTPEESSPSADESYTSSQTNNVILGSHFDRTSISTIHHQSAPSIQNTEELLPANPIRRSSSTSLLSDWPLIPPTSHRNQPDDTTQNLSARDQVEIPIQTTGINLDLMNLFQALTSKLDVMQTTLTAKITGVDDNLNDTKSKLSFQMEQYQKAFSIEIAALKSTQNDIATQVNNLASAHQQTVENVEQLKTSIQTNIKQIHSELHEKVHQLTDHSNKVEHRISCQNNELISKINEQLSLQNQDIERKIVVIQQDMYSSTENTMKHYNQALQGEIIPELQRQHDLLNDQQNRIGKIENTIKEQGQSNKSSWPNHIPIHVTCPNNESMNERLIPKFSGRSTNPNEYLKKIHRYYEKCVTRNPNCDPQEMLIDVLEASLDGHAAQWFQLIKSEVSNWEKFANEFQNKYWNREVQKAIRNRIESERYRPNGTLTRTEYFIERVITLQAITPRIDEEEIINIMCDRFDQLVQDSRNVQNINTIREFERLLHREDLKYGTNRTKQSTTTLDKRGDSNHNSSQRQDNFSGQVDNRAYQNNNHRSNWQTNRTPYQRSAGYPPRQQHPYQSQQQHGNYNSNNPNPNYNFSRSNYRPPPAKEYPTPEQQQICTILRDNRPTQNHTTQANNNSSINSATYATSSNSSTIGNLNK